MLDISWTGLVAMILASFQLISLLGWQEPKIFNGKAHILRIAATLLSSSILVCLLLLLPKIYPLLLILAVAGATEAMLLVTGQVTWHDIHDISEEKTSTKTISSGVPSARQVEAREEKREKEVREAMEAMDARHHAELQDMKEKLRQYQENEKKYIQDISQLNQRIFCLTTMADKKEFEIGYSIPQACQNFLINQIENRKPDPPAAKNLAVDPVKRQETEHTLSVSKSVGASSDNPPRNVEPLQQAPDSNAGSQPTGGGGVSEFQHLMRWNSFKHS